MSKTKSTLIDKELDDKLKSFAKQQKELAKSQKALVNDVVDALKDIIRSAPHIEAIRWHQYTPGFNDGDPCYFTVGDIEVKFTDSVIEEYGSQEKARRDEDEDDSGFVSDYEVEDFLKKKIDVLNHKEIGTLEKQYEAIGKLHDTLSSMENELQTRFGDNMQITVTKNGIDTEDYDCGY